MELRLMQTAVQERKDPFKEKRQQDREDGRQLALTYAEEALLLHVADMRDPAVDPKIRVKCREYVMNRAWGTPKATPDEDPRIANATMLDVLEGISIRLGQEELERRLTAHQEKPVHPAQVALEADYKVMDDDESSTDR